ncbi:MULTISPECIES: hypothetical protein [Caballeronia]|nr:MULTISPECIES: hypothetical protein [Caballeronia]MCE4547939.1 hypothetical protein [Caballeronia sp. PC1]MCE4575552.1 hypothetical protein [Caballeronia sp. CLC5]
MNNVDITAPSLWVGSSGSRCNPMTAAIALRLRPARKSSSARLRNIAGSNVPAALQSVSMSTSTLIDALLRSLGREAGQFAEAMDLTATRSGHEDLMRFVLGGTTAAAVLLLDVPTLFQVPRCNWQAPLLQTRNRLSDDGFKVYAILVNGRREHSLSGALYRLNDRYEGSRLARFCDTNGVGLLTSDEARVAETRNGAEGSLASSIASALMSARHFCCGAFRIGKSDVDTSHL